MELFQFWSKLIYYKSLQIKLQKGKDAFSMYAKMLVFTQPFNSNTGIWRFS